MKQCLRGAKVKAGQGDTGQVVIGAVGDDAGDGEPLGPVGQVHEDAVADGEVVLGRRGLVHDDVVRRGGRVTLHQPIGRQLPAGIEGEAERRAAAAADGVTVAGQELGVAAHRAVDVGHAGQATDRRGDRRRHGLALRGAVDRGVGAGQLRLAADLEADVLVGGTDEVVEGAVERVAQDERARDKRHAQHDGQGGE